jgi:Mrp family chromosome partitioning ATPase
MYEPRATKWSTGYRSREEELVASRLAAMYARRQRQQQPQGRTVHARAQEPPLQEPARPTEEATSTSRALVHVPGPLHPIVSHAVAAEHRCRAGLRGLVDPRLVLLREPGSDRAAAFRLLCQRLVAAGLPRVLAVSSARPHNGKTTCAINLALALTERAHGRGRVLLVDGNFFEPALAEIFAIDEQTPTLPEMDSTGLAPYELFELAPRLDLAAIVPSREDSAPHSEAFTCEALVERLSELPYDSLIIDAPALDGSPKVGRLLAVTDAVLLTVRSGHTSRTDVRRAVDELGRDKVLGAALVDA